MNISLTPELEKYVTSEVVRAGLRLLMERDRMMAARLDELRGEVAEGLEQARRGELVPGEEVEDRIRRKSRNRAG